MTDTATTDHTAPDVIHTMTVPRLARLLETQGFVPQMLKADDGRPAVRFMKLGLAGMALFFGNSEAAPDQFRIVVLSAFVDTVMPQERINAISAKGVLPKIYTTDKSTIFELCIPVEAGFTEQAIRYYIGAFDAFLKAM
jgi:hypothetical protein